VGEGFSKHLVDHLVHAKVGRCQPVDPPFRR
jgi:hypothetical protein